MAKQIPKFQDEDEERKFWETHDSTQYLNWQGAERAISQPEALDQNDIAAPASVDAG